MTKQFVTIDGVEYVRADVVQQIPTGNRAVIVADRGWIFAGDVTESEGMLTLTRAINVRQWESIAFNGMIENPKSPKVTLDSMKNPVEIPVASVLFRVPVSEDWGL